MAHNMDLLLHFWLLSPTPELLLRSNVSSGWLKQGLQGWGRIRQVLCYFGPKSWQGKENVLTQNNISPSHICSFLGLLLPHLVSAVPMLLCLTVGSISLLHNLIHAFITPYLMSTHYPVQSRAFRCWNGLSPPPVFRQWPCLCS